MLPGYMHIPYKDWLTKLSLLTLQQRQLKGNFIEVSKLILIINRFGDANFQNLFQYLKVAETLIQYLNRCFYMISVNTVFRINGINCLKI